MKVQAFYDVGPALFGGYRVALMRGQRCDGQALFETANDVAAEIARLEQTGDGLVSFSVQTTEGAKQTTPQRVLGALALHPSATDAHKMTITHIASGRAVAEFVKPLSASGAFVQLAALDWSQVAGGHTGPDLRRQIDEILIQYSKDSVIALPDVARFGFAIRALPDGWIGLQAPGNGESRHSAAHLAELITAWDAQPPIPADLAAAGVVWRYRTEKNYYQVMLPGDRIGPTGYTPDALFDETRDRMGGLPPAASPGVVSAAATRGLRTTHNYFQTDLDVALCARLVERGYHWEHAKQTPDGRWHHVISARNHALLRNDQILMRRERLIALLEPENRRTGEPTTDNQPPITDDRSSAWHKQQQDADQKWLEDAEMAIGSGAYAYARQLLDRVVVKTMARDTLTEKIPAEPPAPLDPRDEAIRLYVQIAPLLLQIKTEDLEALSMAIANLNECQEGTEGAHVNGVLRAYLDLEKE